jgi:hypothetical protein
MTSPPQNYSEVFSALANIRQRHFLHIAFHAIAGNEGLGLSLKLQPIIETADDWTRYSFNCWIVWTSETPDQWYEKLRTVPEMATVSFLILKVDLSPASRSGQCVPWMWDWFSKPRY